MKAATSRRRSIVQGDVFQQALATNYRFWARLRGVNAVLFLGDPRMPGDKLLAAVDRPVFPKGVCTGCGCSYFDPCISAGGLDAQACAWTDATETRCTHCGPVQRSRRRR